MEVPQNSGRTLDRPLVKSKIIATVGPACESRQRLAELVRAGADLFRLNFAHGTHEWLDRVLEAIRTASRELDRPVGILADLAGPKIRLGELPPDGILLADGARVEFVRTPDPRDPTKLTCSYDLLIDDLQPGDRILLADGMAALRVVEKPPENDCLVCLVDRPGLIRSRQGVNLPGAALQLPALTDKDRDDLSWAVKNRIDYISLSFVRTAEDITQLRAAVAACDPEACPGIIAKIEKMEAIVELDRILPQVDGVMVARGDLGVEVDIALVPALQKRIVHACNEHGVPVITATQMLDSMQAKETPTRAEASDVANAVLDGSDALMLSGETAIGSYPVESVAVMNRIAAEIERFVRPANGESVFTFSRTRAKIVTQAVTLGAGVAAAHLSSDLIVVATRSGRTALAISNQRRQVPILALSDSAATVRKMALYWGVTAIETPIVKSSHAGVLSFVVDWGRCNGVLRSGSRFVLVTSTDWTSEAKDTLLVHVVP
jgi:pyruvate kinase